MELSKSIDNFFRQAKDDSINNRPMNNTENWKEPSWREILGEKVDQCDKAGG
jgi:hypothetical protein